MLDYRQKAKSTGNRAKGLTIRLIGDTIVTPIKKEGGRMAFDANQYIADFKRNNYDQIGILVPKGRKKTIKDCAAREGISVSQLVIKALEECYKLDLSKADGG